MNFGFSEEQELLRSQVRKLLDAHCPMPEVRRIAAGEAGHEPALWGRLAELGLLGVLTPEKDGGAGLGWVDWTVVLEECGRALLPAPLVPGTLAAWAIAELGDDAQRRRLGALCDGDTVATLALLDDEDWLAPEAIRLEARPRGDALVLSGHKRFVADGGAADLFVVACRVDGELRLALVDRDASGLAWAERPSLDRTRRVGTLQLDEVAVPRDALLPGGGDEAIRSLLDAGALAVSAEVIGTCEAILERTTGYARDRVQFGSPIGRYQGVKHPLAELYADVECLKSLVYFAAWTLDERSEEASLAAARAKAWAAETVCRAGVTGIQLHGAIGYTEEHDIQLYLKRSKWARAAFGDEDHHYDRIARLGGL